MSREQLVPVVVGALVGLVTGLVLFDGSTALAVVFAITGGAVGHAVALGARRR